MSGIGSDARHHDGYLRPAQKHSWPPRLGRKAGLVSGDSDHDSSPDSRPSATGNPVQTCSDLT